MHPKITFSLITYHLFFHTYFHLPVETSLPAAARSKMTPMDLPLMGMGGTITDSYHFPFFLFHPETGFV